MKKQPGVYSDIGKNATDILYGDYIRQSPIRSRYNWLDWGLFFKCQVSDIAPGLSSLFKLSLPDQKSNKVEAQYMNNHFGVAAGISLAKSPELSLSGAAGIGFFSIGAEVSFDTATKTAACGAGLGFDTDIFAASLTLTDNADTLRAHCYQQILPLTSTGVAAEVAHRFTRNRTTLALGAQHCLFPFMMIKARVASDGSVGALVRNTIFSALSLSIATEVNPMDAANTAKVGFTIAFEH